MKRWGIFGWILTIMLGVSRIGLAQSIFNTTDPPDYKYPLTPAAGPHIICVKSYRGSNGKELAEEMAEYIRNAYKLPAYILDTGKKQRLAEEARVKEEREKQVTYLKSIGADEAIDQIRVRRIRYEDEYGVFIGGPKEGGWKDWDTARKELDRLRKMPPPPDKLTDKFYQASEGADNKGRKGANVNSVQLNPFATAMVGYNPTIPNLAPKQDPTKLDPFIKQLNAGEEYSVLKCKKPWTLVVKTYSGLGVMRTTEAEPTILNKLGFGKDDTGVYLDATARQSQQMVKNLRAWKHEAYLLHTRSGSIICVGQYDKADDPKLLENAKLFSEMKLREKDTNKLLAEFIPQPLPMFIPR